MVLDVLRVLKALSEEETETMVFFVDCYSDACKVSSEPRVRCDWFDEMRLVGLELCYLLVKLI